MNALVLSNAGGPPAVFRTAANLPDMNANASAGLLPAFGVIGYKGRNWRLKYRGEEELLKDERGVPIPVLSVVIVGISPNVSKIYYEKAFVEGDDAAPDCFSSTGIAPDPLSPKPQSGACATCRKNQFGSKQTDNGKKAKACSDSRRIAVVPDGDIANESYGGPMMLRIPTMSLANLDKYSRELTRFGAQPFMVVTDLGFNYDVAYPEVTFSAQRWLTESEATQVVTAMADPIIERMLQTMSVNEGAAPAGIDPSVAQLAGGAPAHLAQAAHEAVAQQQAQQAAAAQAEAARVAAAQQAAAQAQAEANRVAAEQAAAAQAQIEANRVAAEQAAAAQAAAQAAAAALAIPPAPVAPTPAPVAQAAAPAAAPPAAPPKKSPFGGGARTAAAAPPATAAAPPAQVPVATPPTVVAAGADLEQAIDALLG